MKKIILLLSIMTFSNFTIAFDLTKEDARNFLKDRNISLDRMLKKNHNLLLGEWSGAGHTAPLVNLAAIFHANGAILKNEIKSMNLKGAPGKTLADILAIKAQKETFKRNAILGVLIKK